MAQSGSAGEGALTERRERFDRWRHTRPFAGGTLLILASFVIAWIPINIAPDTIFIGKALSPVGLLFAALVFLSGVFALTRPQFADIFGIFGGTFAIISIYGALGGFGIGTVLGLLGANLCYAWRDDEDDSSGGSGGSENSEVADESGFTFGDNDASAEESGGLFGTRPSGRLSSVRSGPGAGGRTASLALFVLTVVVLAAFAQPLVVAAAQPFPSQTGIGGTVVVANQFSGQTYNHENVTTDTSNRNSVSAGRLSFSSANIDGLKIYKNFRSGPGTPSRIAITGSSASAPDGLSLTTSEFYASQLSLAGVVPLARNKWTTCPGKDFLLRYGDLGPAPGPPISGTGVTSNTHRLSAGTVTIKNFALTMQNGSVSTNVQGTPECTTDPIKPVLDLFTANALSVLGENGELPETVLTNGTVSNLSAPATVNQSESFDVSADVTNTGYVNDTKTVEYRLDNRTRGTKNVSLDRGERSTVTFTTPGSSLDPGTHTYGIYTDNGSATGTIEVVNGTNTTTTTNATNTTNTSNTTNTTNATDATGVTENPNATDGSGTTAPDATAENTTDAPTTVNRTTTASATTETNTTTETVPTNATSTAEPTTAATTTETTRPANGTATSATPTETTTTTETATTVATEDSSATNATASESSLAGLP